MYHRGRGHIRGVRRGVETVVDCFGFFLTPTTICSIEIGRRLDDLHFGDLHVDYLHFGSGPRGPQHFWGFGFLFLLHFPFRRDWRGIRNLGFHQRWNHDGLFVTGWIWVLLFYGYRLREIEQFGQIDRRRLHFIGEFYSFVLRLYSSRHRVRSLSFNQHWNDDSQSLVDLISALIILALIFDSGVNWDSGSRSFQCSRKFLLFARCDYRGRHEIAGLSFD